MADTPLIPNEVDNKHLSDYLNLQKQLTDTFKTNLEIMDKIGHIDRSLETELKKKIDTQRQYLKDNDRLSSDLQRQMDIAKSADAAHKTAIDHNIESLKDMMKYNTDIAASIQQQISYQVQSAEARYKEETKYQDLASKMFSKISSFQSQHLKNYKAIYEELNKSTYGLGKFAGIFAGIFVIMQHTLEVFEKFDKSAASFRMTMGFTRVEALGLRGIAEKLAIDFQHVGVTIDTAYDSIRALSKEMGSAYIVSGDLVKTVALLKSQLGVSEEDSAGFLRNMAAVSKSTMQIQSDMGYTAAAMTQASGVPLAQIMNDIGKASSLTLTMMSRVPNQILRSAIELRRMGSSMNETAKSSREILNFSDNINAEMEASVLLGKSINLQRARELAYRRDLEGSTKEILRITKQMNFESMDVFQQEAFARATGKSVEELTRLVQVDKQWSEARRSTDPELKKMVERYDAMRNASKATVQSETDKLKLMVQQKANQDRLTSISNKWNQILTQAGATFLPIIDGLLSAVIPVMDIAKGIFAWTAGFKGVFQLVTILGNKFKFFENIFYSIVGFGIKLEGMFGKFFGFFSKIGKFLSPVFKFLGIFGGTFGKAIPILGEVIMALQFIWNLGKRLIAIWNDPNMSIGTKILEGLKAVGYAVYDTLIQPFVDAWKWIKGLWGGNSPSKIGLSILTGIVSIGVMMYDALTSPFRNAFAWIADKIPGMGKVAEKLRGGIGGLIHKPVENRAAASYISAVQVSPNGTRIASNPDAKPTQTTTTASEDNTSDKTLNAILNAINTLNSNLESGKIGIYMDGQLLSAHLARQTEFRGGYGVNKV